MFPNVGGQSWSPTESGSPHPASLSSAMTPSTVSAHSECWWEAWLAERWHRADRCFWPPGLGECCSRVGVVGHHEAQSRKEDQQTQEHCSSHRPADPLCEPRMDKTITRREPGPDPQGAVSIVQCSHEGQWHLHGRGLLALASHSAYLGRCSFCPCLWRLLSGAGATVVQDRRGHARTMGQTQMSWGD